MSAPSRLSLRILGCGSSSGTPRIGPDWGSCDPAEPRNHRTRACALVEKRAPDGGLTRVLVDASPDLRAQLLRAEVDVVDAVLFTHAHADQTHGIDDIRALAINAWRAGKRGPFPAWMDAPTHEELARRFAYCFARDPKQGYPPLLDARLIAPGERVSVEGAGGAVDILAFAQGHGPVNSLGFRFGPLAYSSDVKTLPEASFAALEGVDWWAVDALQRNEHPTHAHLALTLAWIARVKPRRGAALTNMHIDMDYATLRAELPAGVEPAYDGMTLEAG